MIPRRYISRSITVIKWMSILLLILSTTLMLSYQLLLINIDRTNDQLAVTHSAEDPHAAYRHTVQPLIGQGDKVRIKKSTSETARNLCTVGYIDTRTRRAYISAHCGEDGVYTFASDGAPLGIFHRPDNNANVDIGYIQLESFVYILGNSFAEHEATSPTPHLGQTVCQYSRNANQTHCSKIALIRGREVLTLTKMISSPGDSGGPVWIPDKDGKHHIIGIHSGFIRNDYYPEPMSRFFLLDLD